MGERFGEAGRRIHLQQEIGDARGRDLLEVPRVLFLGICLDFYYFLRRVLLPKIGFHFDWGSVSQAL
ncbi:hypothetical protein, partial [Corynebacterium tuberculostearicum]|uniref:hypothetical protein n=1 Tax=Corynebacterium tuberculostearicum TaxID=38304 RepID=UPI0020268E13